MEEEEAWFECRWDKIVTSKRGRSIQEAWVGRMEMEARQLRLGGYKGQAAEDEVKSWWGANRTVRWEPLGWGKI